MEPRGFEPLTSAVQRRRHSIAAVRWCSKIPAYEHIHPKVLSPVFAIVRPGWCQLVWTSLYFNMLLIALDFPGGCQKSRADE